jgi:hypothetical protein
VIASLGVTTIASAQPAPEAPEGDKQSAKALLQSGLKLFAAKDYLGALAVFRDAYSRFPSGKILLNIGTTLIKLDRPAEAANAYQRYLDSPDVDPAKKDEALRALAELDKKVGVVEISVAPADAEVQVGTDEWRPAAQQARIRVMPGSVVVRARRAKYKPSESTIAAQAGTRVTAKLTLEAVPETVATPGGGDIVSTGNGVSASFEPERRSRFAALVLAHIDPANKGAAALVGVEADVIDRLQIRGAAILGPYFGGYIGGTFAILTGRVRPIVVAGLPVFRSDGWRVAVRGAGGVEVAVNRHIAVTAELGVEHLFNPQDSVDSATLFVPAVGVTGRL